MTKLFMGAALVLLAMMAYPLLVLPVVPHPPAWTEPVYVWALVAVAFAWFCLVVLMSRRRTPLKAVQPLAPLWEPESHLPVLPPARRPTLVGELFEETLNGPIAA